jgi:hypothetical protein
MAISFKKEVITEAIKQVLAEAEVVVIGKQDPKRDIALAKDRIKKAGVNNPEAYKNLDSLKPGDTVTAEDHHLDPNDESDMAKVQLANVIHYAQELLTMIKDGQQLDAWVQSKLTIAFDYIDSVKHYLEGEDYLAATEAPAEEEPIAEMEDDADVSGLDAGFEDDTANAPKGDKKLNKQLSKNDKIIAAFNELRPLFKLAAAGDKDALETLKASQHVVVAYKKLKQI